MLENWKSIDERLAAALAELTPFPSLKKRGKRTLKAFRGEFKKEAFKIVLLGPESTGKTTLTKQLAEHFETNWIPEYTRQYIDELDRPYQESDLLVIAKGQLQLEDEKSKEASRLLFCDTNLITIKIWSEFKYGRVDLCILESLKTRTYDFYLLMDTDIPWEPDPHREHPEQRQVLFDLHKEYLDFHHLPYEVVSGLDLDRFENAQRIINSRADRI